MLLGMVQEKRIVKPSFPFAWAKTRKSEGEGMLMAAHQRAGLLVVYSQPALQQAFSIV